MKDNKLIKYMDKPLLIFMILYCCIGLLAVLSASNVAAVLRYGVSPYYFFFKQLIFIGISFLIGFIFVIKIDIGKYKNLVFFALIVLVAMLFGLLLYGKMVNSAKSWIDLGFFSVQPSEFIKLILVLYMGIFFGDYTKNEGKKSKIWILLAVCGGAILLVAAQPDFGTASIIAAIVFLTFIAVPFKKNNLVSLLKISGGAAVLVVVIFLSNASTFLNEMQLSRFQFQNPCSRYTEDTGYQVCNGFIAIHNGGLGGLGIGESTQKYLYLPEAHTDFIFAIIVEEVGVIIAAFILAGYIYIIYRIIKIAKQSYNLRNSIICYGIAMIMLMHILINFLGLLAIVPLTGVPIPLLSSGGSITITIIIALFVVQRVAIENNLTKKKIEISKITGK